MPRTNGMTEGKELFAALPFYRPQFYILQSTFYIYMQGAALFPFLPAR